MVRAASCRWLYPEKAGSFPGAAAPLLEVVGGLSGRTMAAAEAFLRSCARVTVLGIGGMIGSGRTELFEGLMGLRPCHPATPRGPARDRRSPIGTSER